MEIVRKISLWKLLRSITCKSDWYNKIFDDTIIAKWKSEITVDFSEEYPNQIEDIFNLAIKTLQASAQGNQFHSKCEWYYDGDRNICDVCMNKLKKDIRKSPKEYGIESDEDLGENLIDDYDLYDIVDELMERDYCTHALCSCKSPDHKLEDYIKYLPSGLLTKDQRIQLKSLVVDLLDRPIDWHPNSNEQVRDLVHPSLYPYVRGTSICDGKTEKEVPEKYRYQWLPSEVKVNLDGSVKFESYINNLPTDLDCDAVNILESTLAQFIPEFSRVLHTDLSNKQLQVIVKLGSTHLNSDKPVFPGGSWHIEGTPQEHIVATGLHYITVEGITDSFLEFRKPVIIDRYDLDYPQSNDRFTTHHYGIEPHSHHDGKMNRYLGLIKCQEGASVVFPNTLQHHVKEFKLPDTVGTRIILAFFLVDPDHPIISTKNVLPQQSFYDGDSSPVVFTEKEAKQHRERLMFHRKYVVDEMNRRVYEREYSLCEH